jgi:pimeloyl-ACP methyl ester carboxylesterase
VGLHGFSDAPGCLHPFLSALGVHDAVTPALLAHDGRVMPAGVPFADDVLVADARKAVADVVGSRGAPAVLMGHSLGASTAAGVAATAAHLVCALVLEDPPWQLPDSPDGTSDADRSAEAENGHRPWLVGLAGTDDEGRRAWVRDNHPSWPDDEQAPWARAKTAVDLRLFDAQQRWLRRRWRGVATAIHSPTLLLVGDADHDTACAPEVSGELAALPGWTVTVVPGAGHNVRRDQRDLTVAAVTRFLRRSLRG